MPWVYPDEYYTHVGAVSLEEFEVLLLSATSVDEKKTLIQYQRLNENKYKYNKLQYFKPDDWFMDIANKMELEQVCGAIAGNRSGKTFSSTWLYALHVTGLYPDWYTGYRFNVGIDTWVLTPSADQCAQAGGMSEYLFGSVDDIGSGWIPKDRIIDHRVVTTQKGNKYVNSASIRHVDGSVSRYEYKSYEQQVINLMGASISFALIDEEAPMSHLSQVITRIATPKTGAGTGRVLVAMTPEKG